VGGVLIAEHEDVVLLNVDQWFTVAVALEMAILQ
jgi:hypothetical protein